MKRIKVTLITSLSLVLLAIGCKKIEQLLTFHISDECTTTIQSTTPVNLPFEVPTPDVTTNSSQEFSNNNTKAGLVKDVKLDELKITITNPSAKTFSFLKSVHLYISTGSHDEIELAYLDNISSTTNTVNLITTQSKLDQYVKASGYKLRTSVVTRETLTQNTDVKINLRFKVTANL
jgi:hypothetical protein